MCYRRFLTSLLVGTAVAWGMWLSPLQRPRATLARPANANPHPSIFFTPDSRNIVSVGVDPVRDPFEYNGNWGAAHLWDTDSGHCLAVLKDRGPLINSVTFSPDGGKIAGRQQNGKILVWERATGKLLHEIWHDWLKEANPHTQIVYAPDGRLLYEHAEHWTQLFDVETNKLAFDL